MVFFLIPVIVAAVAAVFVSEIVRRPLGELFEGMILTEEAPVRTAMTMYVAGAVDLDYFKRVMAKHNIEATDQAAYINYATLRIAEKNQAEALQTSKSVTNALEDINKKYDKLDEQADDIEYDSYVQDVKNAIVDLDLERDAVKTLLTAAVKKGTEAPILDAIKAINAEIAKLSMMIFDKRKEQLAAKKARIDKEYDAVKALQPAIPGIPVFPPLPPVYGEVTYDVKSTPAGATVYFDGVSVGVTPCVIKKPPVAGYEIEVVLEGYETWAVSSLAVAGKTYSYSPTLTAKPPPPPPQPSLYLSTHTLTHGLWLSWSVMNFPPNTTIKAGIKGQEYWWLTTNEVGSGGWQSQPATGVGNWKWYVDDQKGHYVETDLEIV